MTLPATVDGIRPKTSYSYSSFYGQYLDGGSLTNFATPIVRLTAISQCSNNATCAGTADEVKTTIAYGTANVLPTSVTRAGGNPLASATTAYGYDSVGNVVSVDGPLSGTADTTAYKYDLDRERVGTVSPDPDGGGGLKNRAVRVTYGATGLVTKQELGTTAGQSDAAWAGFAPLEAVEIGYDSNQRPVTRKLSGGGTAYALTQVSYDDDGRIECSAVRMNPSVYANLPADACKAAPQGSYGPDRITRISWDPVGRPLDRTEAYRTPDESTTSLTYTANGKVATLEDGENNLTTFVYDGFDRLSKTRYPLPANGANASSTSDYEQLSYDANSNVVSLRTRAGQTIGFSYDKLDRLITKNLPTGEPDVAYTYDNLGHVLTASQTGNVLSFTWDALGRNLTQVGPQGTVTSAWDAAGRRTKLTYPDGYYLNYDHLVTGEVAKIRENGATSGIGVLANYAYDQLGNRASVTFGNGTSTTYGYDPVSRLSSLSLDFAGTADDLTKTFSYNPASQIVSETSSNDLFAWTGAPSGTTTTVTNGLNQLVTVGGVAATHDANGNLTTDPASGLTFAYDSQNQLKSASGATPPTLTYDPAGRLWQLAAGTGASRTAYDGLDALTMQDTSGTLFRRFVNGPGTAEHIVQYEGAGATTRRFLATGERGSIIAMSDDSGNVTAINTYDEYGVPAASNVGTFQYAGQMWQSLLGAYYSRARMYEPRLGRFLQPDPIGYAGDGPNLYAYVLDDPVNLVDPSGTIWIDGVQWRKACVSLGDNPPSNCSWKITGYEPFYFQNRFGNARESRHLRLADCPLILRICPEELPQMAGPAPAPKARQSNQCAAALGEAGEIEASAAGYAAIVGGGVVGAYGTFRNLETGTTGRFWTLGGGGAIGFEAGVSLTKARYATLSSFAGFVQTFGATAGPFVGSLSFSAKGEFVGWNLGFSTPGASASYTGTSTQLFSCRLGS